MLHVFYRMSLAIHAAQCSSHAHQVAVEGKDEKRSILHKCSKLENTVFRQRGRNGTDAGKATIESCAMILPRIALQQRACRYDCMRQFGPNLPFTNRQVIRIDCTRYALPMRSIKFSIRAE